MTIVTLLSLWAWSQQWLRTVFPEGWGWLTGPLVDCHCTHACLSLSVIRCDLQWLLFYCTAQYKVRPHGVQCVFVIAPVWDDSIRAGACSVVYCTVLCARASEAVPIYPLPWTHLQGLYSGSQCSDCSGWTCLPPRNRESRISLLSFQRLFKNNQWAQTSVYEYA